MADPRPTGLADVLDRLRLHRLAGARTYDRAFEYARDGRVQAISATPDAIRATVRGSRRYVVSLELVDDGLVWRCDCPVGVDGELCKHAVALGLAWLDGREVAAAGVASDSGGIAARRTQGVGPEPAITMDQATSWLHTLDAGALADILVTEAGRDDRLRQQLLRRAEAGRQDTVAVAALRQAFDRAVRIRDFVPYGEAHGYAEGIDAVIDRIDGLLAAGAAAAVVILVEDALHSLEDVIGMIDDSDGWMGGLKERLEDLHLAACEAAQPEPVELAQRLFAWETASEWEVFHGASRRYADILGPDGLAEYRRLAAGVWATLPRLGPGERPAYEDEGGLRRGPSRFTITAIMETLADLAGDADGLIAVMTHDLSYAYHYLQIARVCMAAGREDQAIDWAERGVRAFPVRTDDRLRLFLVDRYQARARHGEAMALVWASFTERPDRDRYRQLEASATVAGAWPDWHDRALAHVRSLIKPRTGEGNLDPRAGWRDWPVRPDASTLVDLLLADGDVEEAWSTASAHGCRRSLWLDLARVREADHPLDAVSVYQREVEHQIATKRNDGYRQAGVLIGCITQLLDAAGRAADVQPYVADLRARHRQKRNLIAVLDGGRIGR